MLLDHICSSTDLQWSYSDGFTEQGSPYYGELVVKRKNSNTEIEEIITEYKARLRTFTNDYSNQLRLYKLHGSIDTHRIMNSESTNDRIKSLYGIHDYMKEVKDNDGKLSYENCVTNSFPDYLSGTTEKLLSYSDPYYSQLFEHFETALPKCEKLMVIGYGFWDSGINKFLQKEIIDNGIPITAIDPYEPKGPLYQEHKDKIIHLEMDLKDITLEEFEGNK